MCAEGNWEKIYPKVRNRLHGSTFHYFTLLSSWFFLMWKCISPESGNCWVEVCLHSTRNLPIVGAMKFAPLLVLLWFDTWNSGTSKSSFQAHLWWGWAAKFRVCKARWPRNNARSKLDLNNFMIGWTQFHFGALLVLATYILDSGFWGLGISVRWEWLNMHFTKDQRTHIGSVTRLTSTGFGSEDQCSLEPLGQSTGQDSQDLGMLKTVPKRRSEISWRHTLIVYFDVFCALGEPESSSFRGFMIVALGLPIFLLALLKQFPNFPHDAKSPLHVKRDVHSRAVTCTKLPQKDRFWRRGGAWKYHGKAMTSWMWNK